MLSTWLLRSGLLLAALLIWFSNLEYRKLIKPDEGRYAEISREMAVSGDWVTPRLNGVKYFEKPPLQYWAGAAAIERFGAHQWTARLWTALTGALGILLGILSAVRHNSSVDVGTMVGANVGVSMPVFWLGLMLAYLFAILLKGTPLWLPPSARLTAGVSMQPLAQAWQLENLPAFPRFLVDLLSNSVILHSLLVGKFDVTWDAIRHLILPSLAVGTIPDLKEHFATRDSGDEARRGTP